MLTLDRETADLVVANAVRFALERAPEHHHGSVEETAKALLKAKLLDMKTACYVLFQPGRFCSLPPPLLFDARWHFDVEAQHSEARKTCSAHPFPTHSD